jgi:hypothetical protein
MSRMSAKVIFCGRLGMAHDPADLNDREATTPLGAGQREPHDE